MAGEHNNHRPHLLRETAALGCIAIFICILTVLNSLPTFINQNNLLGEVYPAIVAVLTNQGRVEQALPTLKESQILAVAAKNKAQDMITRGYFAHQSPDGRQPWDWIKSAGYEYEYAGENLAINYSDSADVYRAWMNSPTHKANILNGHYTEIGIAVATTTIQGRESILVVQMFGSPKNHKNGPKSAVSATSTVGADSRIVSNIASDTDTSTSTTSIPAPTATSVTPIFSTVTTSSPDVQVLGASAENETDTAITDSVDLNKNAALGFLVTNPRTVSLFVYIFFIFLLNIAVISLGVAEYRLHHKKSIFVAVLLLLVLTLISYSYLYFKAPEVIIF